MPTKVELQGQLEETQQALKDLIEILDQVIAASKDELDSLEGISKIAKSKLEVKE